MSEERKIEISKSALISLKAELLRKQDEVSNAKRDSKNQIENFKSTSKFSKTIETTSKEKDKPKQNVIDVEECEMLRKSKAALEKKSLLYEHLSRSSSTADTNEQFLVQFDKKQRENQGEVSQIEKDYQKQGDEDLEDSSKQYSSDSDEEWVDYVDCLGRTRRCHKSDLEHVKKQDEHLRKSVGVTSSEPKEAVNKTWVKEGEALELEPPDAYKEQLRKQWEQKEQELLTKDDVHYEDVLFNEARSHGAGYYALSGDAAERAKQQAELAATRSKTEKAQSDVNEARKKREEALQARVKAARARQRARAGLPPEEEEPKPSVTSMLLDFIEKQKDVSIAKDAEEARVRQEEKEEEAKREREKFVREWDVGKEGVKMPFVQMTQEQWVDKKRKERIEEFAPLLPTSFKSKSSTREFDNQGFFVDTQGSYKTDESSQPSTSIGGRRKQYYDPSVNQSTSSFQPVAFQNECDEEVGDRVRTVPKNKPPVKGVEIAPPTMFEYYGPPDKKNKPSKDTLQSNIHEAFEQGLKYLEDKKTKGKPKE